MFKTHARRVLAASAIIVTTFGGLLALARPASADPINAKDSLVVTVMCANGNTYSVVTNGNGNFTPAHDVNSTAMLIPLWFGEQTFTLTDPNGVVVDQETVPASAKGSSASAPNRATQTACTFSGSQTDPSSGFTFTIAGSVVGFVTPSR